MGKLAILGKLWGYVVQFFAKLYGAKMAEADAKYAKASALMMQWEAGRQERDALYASAVAEILDLRTERATLAQIAADQKAHIQKLENDLEQQKLEISRLSDHDAVRSDIFNVSANGGHK